jgi:DNA-binding CsgD family transcriptional regulator
VLVVDTHMPGPAVTELVRLADPSTRGAARELAEAIRAVAAGFRVTLAEPAADPPDPLAEPERDDHAELLLRSLSERKRQILTLLARGYSNHRIAESCYLSLNTVRTHVQNVLVKLGVHAKLEAAALAVRQGLVSAGLAPTGCRSRSCNRSRRDVQPGGGADAVGDEAVVAPGRKQLLLVVPVADAAHDQPVALEPDFGDLGDLARLVGDIDPGVLGDGRDRGAHGLGLAHRDRVAHPVASQPLGELGRPDPRVHPQGQLAAGAGPAQPGDQFVDEAGDAAAGVGRALTQPGV